MNTINIYIILFLIGLSILGIVLNNRIIRRKNAVANAYGSMEIYLKKRFDLLPNLIALLKKYMAHEQQSLLEITHLRSLVKQSDDMAEQIAATNQLTDTLGKLQVQVEAYPELKADGQFARIQCELVDIEEQISAARRAYNAAVIRYNDTIETIPTNIVAKLRHDQTAELLHIPKQEQQEINIQSLFNS